MTKDAFIEVNYLYEAVGTAIELIHDIFGNTSTDTELYIDHDDPQYKFLNIVIKPLNVESVDQESLLIKFDKLMDLFHSKVDNRYSSKITFHLNIP
ncbi:MAG: hypothetical protein HQK96_14815 [Nitrospirae bacterium]|nr:hypothetical protein [Nitrospirota bacterium]